MTVQRTRSLDVAKVIRRIESRLAIGSRDNRRRSFLWQFSERIGYVLFVVAARKKGTKHNCDLD